MSEGDAGDRGIDAVAEAAAALVENGMRVGLGSGRAALAFVDRLGARVRAGLRVAGVATSSATAQRAREQGIPLLTLDDAIALDLTVDGADEVTPELDLLKGRGGALVRDRIVAAASRRQVIVAGAEKRVRALGERMPVPVEVVRFAVGFVERRVAQLGLAPALRRDPHGEALVTENGNSTLDCALRAPVDGRAARELERALRAIPGVVDTGLFLGTAERVLIGHPDGHVEVMARRST
jgi:ribose 5-phosphate isomerase A